MSLMNSGHSSDRQQADSSYSSRFWNLTISKHNRRDRKSYKTYSQKRRCVKKKLLHASFGIISSEITAESRAKSTASVLQQNRNCQKNSNNNLNNCKYFHECIVNFNVTLNNFKDSKSSPRSQIEKSIFGLPKVYLLVKCLALLFFSWTPQRFWGHADQAKTPVHHHWHKPYSLPDEFWGFP